MRRLIIVVTLVISLMLLVVPSASAAQGVITEVNPSGVSNGLSVANGTEGVSTAGESRGISVADGITDVGLDSTPARGLVGPSKDTGVRD